MIKKTYIGTWEGKVLAFFLQGPFLYVLIVTQVDTLDVLSQIELFDK